MMIVRDLHIEVGPRVLLDGAAFTIHPGDKIGLVGRNGAGKTTLMRTLTGERAIHSGSIDISGRMAYFSQTAHLPREGEGDITALERVLAARGFGELQERISATLDLIEHSEGAEQERLINRHARLLDEFETAGGYAAEAEAKQIASSVGIETEELDQAMATMSGGQRRRVELARILFSNSETLLLDEPTNHLDLDAKTWLMEYLAQYKGGLLVVSHDLPLLDQSITSVLSLDNGKIEPYRGNYSHFLEERDRRRDQRVRERVLQDRKIADLEKTINRFRGSTEKMAKKAKSMETRVDRMKDQLTEVEQLGANVNVAFPQPPPSNRTPVEGKGLAKAFGDNVVFVDIDVYLERGETMIIIGLNGAGKTTLLRILAGVEDQDLGEIEIGDKTRLGYYAQEHEQVRSGKTVYSHVREVSELPDGELRALLGRMLLGETIDQDAGTLSGGEKTKLALAMVVLAQPNVMLLDEPTNNLDPQARDALLEALRDYTGTIVLVSHDTDFVEELNPDRAIVMPDGTLDYFDKDMLELVALT
jgi:ATPase subunit of ABC transporter with duplicated ATPase domains